MALQCGSPLSVVGSTSLFKGFLHYIWHTGEQGSADVARQVFEILTTQPYTHPDKYRDPRGFSIKYVAFYP